MFQAYCPKLTEKDNPKIKFDWSLWAEDGGRLNIPRGDPEEAGGIFRGRTDTYQFRVNSHWLSGVSKVDLRLKVIYKEEAAVVMHRIEVNKIE